MRTWQGIRDSQSDAVESGGLGNASRGLSFSVDGEVRRRTGLTYLEDQGALSMASLITPLAGAWLIAVGSDGNIEAISL